jgi:hypothetical protein
MARNIRNNTGKKASGSYCVYAVQGSRNQVVDRFGRGGKKSEKEIF